MEVKKNPKVKLENFSKVFMQIGLVTTLLITFIIMESKSKVESDVKKEDKEEVAIVSEIVDFTIEEPEIEEPQQPQKKAPVVVEEVKVEEDDKKIEEQEFETADEQEPEPVDSDFDKPAPPAPKPKITKEVSFMTLEEVPVYPGCTGTKAELKKCLQEKIREHVGENFDSELANELGLDSGRKRIMVQFKIGVDGKVGSIMAVAPHPRLKNEASRIIKKLPKMTPGRQRGNAVIVRYALPIDFIVE